MNLEPCETKAKGLKVELEHNKKVKRKNPETFNCYYFFQKVKISSVQNYFLTTYFFEHSLLFQHTREFIKLSFMAVA
jgi:hypothetical protein